VKLKDVEQRVKLLRATAIPAFIPPLVLFCLGGAKLIHFTPWKEYPLAAIILLPALSIVESFYAHTRFASILWDMAPLPSFENLGSAGNCYALFLLCVITIAALMLRSANHLSSRIKAIRKKAEEQGWLSSMDGQVNRVLTLNELMSLEIHLGPKDRWHSGPMGIIVLAVTGGVLIQVANLFLGLV
jgi:hypothetical protein